MPFNNLFVCGSGSFEDDPLPHLHARSITVKTNKKKRRKKKKKNPYSKLGLDKYATLLAVLEEERTRIYGQMGSKDIVLVRFGHTDGKKWVPIVVVKSRGQEESPDEPKHVDDQEDKPKHVDDQEDKPKLIEGALMSFNERIIGKKMNLFSRSLDGLYYWFMVVVSIVLCLVMCGRSFAIICVTIWWYLLPEMKRDGMAFRRSMKKKDYHNMRSMERSSPT